LTISNLGGSASGCSSGPVADPIESYFAFEYAVLLLSRADIKKAVARAQ
jgi:hypothetical protein